MTVADVVDFANLVRGILTWLAILAGLVAAIAVALVIAVYAVNILFRSLKHFSLSSLPPSLTEITGPGVSVKFQKAEETTHELVETVDDHEARLQILETNYLKTLAEGGDQ